MSSVVAFLVAAGATFALGPLVIALARRMSFYDHPAVGHKLHDRATPYLGGAALFGGFAVGALATGHLNGRFGVLAGCAAGLLVVGTLDDRVLLLPGWRVLSEVGAAVVLYETGNGWSVLGWGPADLALTVVWVVGLVNAFNLMDNLDGATATVAGVASAGVGGVGLLNGDTVLAAFAFAISGACVGFLPFNLARPARIFLGDGGSMPLGFLVAASAVAAADQHALGSPALLAGALLVGMAILDTTLVVVSRHRAGVPLVTAGRDHLTHRLLTRLGSPHRVAATLGLAQAGLCSLAIAGVELGSVALSLGAGACVVAGLAAIVFLDSPAWRPVREVRRLSAAPRYEGVAVKADRGYKPATSSGDAG